MGILVLHISPVGIVSKCSASKDSSCSTRGSMEVLTNWRDTVARRLWTSRDLCTGDGRYWRLSTSGDHCTLNTSRAMGGRLTIDLALSALHTVCSTMSSLGFARSVKVIDNCIWIKRNCMVIFTPVKTSILRNLKVQ